MTTQRIAITLSHIAVSFDFEDSLFGEQVRKRRTLKPYCYIFNTGYLHSKDFALGGLISLSLVSQFTDAAS